MQAEENDQAQRATDRRLTQHPNQAGRCWLCSRHWLIKITKNRAVITKSMPVVGKLNKAPSSAPSAVPKHPVALVEQRDEKIKPILVNILRDFCRTYD